MSFERPSFEQQPSPEKDIASAEGSIKEQEANVERQEEQQGAKIEGPEMSAETPEGVTEAKPEQEAEVFDVERGKQEYAEVRLGWARSEAEYNRLSKEQLEAADALIANPKDVDAKIRFWKIAEQLDKAREEREKFGDQQSELVGKLLEGENGAQNFEGAEAAFGEKLGEFIKENPELSEYLVAGGLEGMKALQERMEKLAELQQKFNELQEKVTELNERYATLKEEDEKLAAEAEVLSKAGKEKDIVELKENTNKRREVLGKMKSMEGEYKELTAAFEELAAEFQALS
jgi:uncharacterized coiled-coil DUF342 family protein